MPFRQFVLKWHSRCDLACSYCYVYTFADQSWRDQPHRMAPAVLAATARRIAEHAAEHRLTAVEVVFHGGEPLLTGPGPLAQAVRVLRAALPARCALRAVVQTNGTGLTDAVLDELGPEGVRFSVSIDGGTAAHNGRRLLPSGAPSFPLTAAGIHRLRHRPELYAGLLAVVDLAMNPVETYESLLAFEPPQVDLLLPHGNWSAPPPGLSPAGYRGAPLTPYADWLTAVFDRWWHGGRGDVRIRLFEEAIALLLGVPGSTELLGTSPAALVLVATDGAIEQVDSLRSAYPGAARTGLHVLRDSFDTALRHPAFAARQAGPRGLPPACRTCPLGLVCGGGQYPHRYRQDEGFDRPSVYCSDLYVLLRHIAAALRREAAPADPPTRTPETAG